MVLRNKRYIVWFYVLNLFLGLLGTMAFVNQEGAILDNSLQSERFMHGFPLGAVIEMVALPEYGPTIVSRLPAMCFALLFMVTTAVFLPGVFQGYASTYRLPRDDFFRTCGRNLWRFIRLIFIAGIVMGIATGLLFWIHGILERKATESTNELLLPEVRFVGLFIIFLAMTAFRIWFDLAETDAVLNDQRAVRKSIGAAFRHTRPKPWSAARKLFRNDDCCGDPFDWRALVLVEVCNAAEYRGRVFVSQLTLLPSADSSLLATRSRSVLLAAANAGSGRCRGADRAGAISGCSCARTHACGFELAAGNAGGYRSQRRGPRNFRLAPP